MLLSLQTCQDRILKQDMTEFDHAAAAIDLIKLAMDLFAMFDFSLYQADLTFTRGGGGRGGGRGGI